MSIRRPVRGADEDEHCHLYAASVGVRVVDLSIIVDSLTPVFPGDPRPELRSAATIESDGFNVLALSLGSHTGTHVDSPRHFIRDGARLQDLDHELFVGAGVIADVRGVGSRSAITWTDLETVADRLGPGTILAIRTGWSDRFLGTAQYFDHPFLDPEACARVMSLGVRTIAIDTLSPDETVVDGSPPDFSVHEMLLGAGGVIAENLTNLGAVDFPAPIISLLPLRLGGAADGSPCRAVALQLSR